MQDRLLVYKARAAVRRDLANKYFVLLPNSLFQDILQSLRDIIFCINFFFTQDYFSLPLPSEWYIK